MKQQVHYAAVSSGDAAVTAERERLINGALEPNPAGERGEQLDRSLAAAALQQVVDSGGVASGPEEQGQTGAKTDAAIPPVSRTDSMADEEAVERGRQRGESERKLLANVYADPKRHTVAFLLDDVTANMVMYAVRVLAADSEAHAREVRLIGATMPPESYGAANRHAIASRHERFAHRLRTLEGNYHHVTTMPGMA
jgi:septal ring-binding cell division protein DamX